MDNINEIKKGKLYFMHLSDIHNFCCFDKDFKEWDYNKSLSYNLDNFGLDYGRISDTYISETLKTYKIYSNNIIEEVSSKLRDCIIMSKYLGNGIFEEMTSGLKFQCDKKKFDSISGLSEVYLEYPSYLMSRIPMFGVEYDDYLLTYDKNDSIISVDQFNKIMKEYVEKIKKYPFMFRLRTFDFFTGRIYDIDNEEIMLSYLRFPNEYRILLLNILKEHYKVGNSELLHDVDYYIKRNEMWPEYIEEQKQSSNKVRKYKK